MSADPPPPRRDPRALRNERQRRATPSIPGGEEQVAAPSAGVPRLDPRRRQQERRRDGVAADTSPPSEAPQSTTAPATPPRRDPRALGRSRAAPPKEAIAEQVSVTRVESPAAWCLAVPDVRDGSLSTHDREVMAAARLAADRLQGGVIALAPAAAGDWAALGVDRLIDRQGGDGFAPAGRLAMLQAIVAAHAPKHVFLPDTTVGGGHIGRLLATRLRAAIVTNVVRLSASEAVCRGDGGRREDTVALPAIVLLAPEAVTPRFAGRRQARRIEIATTTMPEPIVDRGRLALDASDMPLADADFIVSAGVGVTEWQRFLAVAKALRATVGCTRAVCDAGHLPRSRQVGASGTLVDPRCYLSFGISGAPQHLQGIARCERVVAVNTDLHAEMVKRAELAIVADAQPVMASLLELMEQPR